MADVQITDLTTFSSPNNADSFIARHGNSDQRIVFSDLKSAITKGTLFVSDDGVVTDEANKYYNRSQVDTKITNLQTQIDTLNSKIPTAPSSNGTYRLTCTKTSSATTYSWTT